jgi:mxaJ protein
VCSDPNNLPFSNDRGEGFENAIAELVARELGRTVQYTWWPQRRGFIRNTLQAGECDLVIGLPADYELARTTRPYYRSTYVFVTRRDGPVQVTSLDDDILRRGRIGFHVIGDDYASVPPAQALASRGIVGNIRGYSIYGDYAKPNPPASLIEAVASGDVDIALAWGPLAGYFASRQSVPLRITPIVPERDGPVPFTYDISMGVRRDADALHERLDEIILKRRGEIDQVLQTFGVPLVPTQPDRNSPLEMRASAGPSPSAGPSWRSEPRVRERRLQVAKDAHSKPFVPQKTIPVTPGKPPD